MVSEKIWTWSASRTAGAIRAGEISCREAVSAAVERMQASNPAINAVTLDLSEQALADAARADDARSAGERCGPLHGVPITIKENADQEGLPNPNGVAAFKDLIAPGDASVVVNLKKAGAIVIGRTNTPEFSLRYFTDNPLRGLTHNPWKEGITPGGSSGGAAASVAMGIGDIAHGNDLGGSLRYPAYACGVATIRPSLGRVPAYNPSSAEERPPTFQLMSVQGPIARQVEDVRLALSVMAAGDPRDPWWVPAPLEGPDLSVPVGVAVVKAPAGLACAAPVAQAIDSAAAHLSEAGYRLEEVEPPHLAEIAACWRDLLFTDVEAMLASVMREHGSADIGSVYDSYCSHAKQLDLEGYVRALSARAGYLRDWSVFMERFPLVLAPVSLVPPMPQGEDLKGGERMGRMLEEQSLLYSVNLLGLPAAAVPTGLHDGVPLGVQIIGPRFREDLCLTAAQAIEERTGVLAERLWAAG
jgi:amidase